MGDSSLGKGKADKAFERLLRLFKFRKTYFKIYSR